MIIYGMGLEFRFTVEQFVLDMRYLMDGYERMTWAHFRRLGWLYLMFDWLSSYTCYFSPRLQQARSS